MRHPFDLNDSELEALDLDFEEELTEEEAAQVGGGLSLYTTKALGEEGGGFTKALGEGGGDFPKPIPFDPPHPFPFPKPIPVPEPHPPIATTLAIGEEGGDDLPVTTLAIGEEGGGYPIC